MVARRRLAAAEEPSEQADRDQRRFARIERGRAARLAAGGPAPGDLAGALTIG